MSELYYLSCTVCGWYLRVFHDSRVEGQENVPEGPCVLTSNHVSFLDPPLIASHLGTAAYILARKTLFKPPLLDWLLPRVQTIPVDQERPDMVGLKKIIHAAQEGKKVLLFPEGARSFDGKLQRAQPGIGMLVAKAKVPVVPMRVFGPFEAWPRNGKLKPFVPVRLVIGKPIVFPDKIPSNKESYQAVADRIMEEISKLK